MKGRESGMSAKDYWNSFFDPACVLDKLLGAKHITGNIVEFGFGYGTFTFAAACRTSGDVIGFDIDKYMAGEAQRGLNSRGISNVQLRLRDFVERGTGLSTGSADHAMIYNLLHIERPVLLLKEAFRILASGGTASILHWRRDMPTPRGPSIEIRPSIEQCQQWAAEAGFRQSEKIDVSRCCKYHYGIRLYK